MDVRSRIAEVVAMNLIVIVFIINYTSLLVSILINRYFTHFKQTT